MTLFSPARLADDIRRLGVHPGAAIMVHVSLRAIGPVQGGAESVLDALELAVGRDGGLLMVLGAKNDWDWVNERSEHERAALLANAEPFDAAITPAEPEVGYLAEVFRLRPGTLFTNNPEGRFAARGALAPDLLADAPWHDYYGLGSPLDRLCQLNGSVLRLGADPDTTTLLHFAEHLVPLPSKRRVRRHRRVHGPDGPEIRVVECLDDSSGIVDWSGEDYFKLILEDYLDLGHSSSGLVGNAKSELINAQELVDFGVRWMGAKFS